MQQFIRIRKNNWKLEIGDHFNRSKIIDLKHTLYILFLIKDYKS